MDGQPGSRGQVVYEGCVPRRNPAGVLGQGREQGAMKGGLELSPQRALDSVEPLRVHPSVLHSPALGKPSQAIPADAAQALPASSQALRPLTGPCSQGLPWLPHLHMWLFPGGLPGLLHAPCLGSVPAAQDSQEGGSDFGFV